MNFPSLKVRPLYTTVAFAILMTLAFLIQGCSSGGGGGGSNSSGGSSNSGTLITATADIPFQHEFTDKSKSDPNNFSDTEFLHAVVNDTYTDSTYRYKVVSGAWAPFSPGHTGHQEGDVKINMEIQIVPDTIAREIKYDDSSIDFGGNNDGNCDSGELCGVRADTAIRVAPWYRTFSDSMVLTELTVENGGGEPYLPNETDRKYRATVKWGGLALSLDHVADWSSTAKELIENREGSSFFPNPPTGDYQYHNDPIDLPGDTRLARPQVINRYETVANSDTYYFPVAQTEWNIQTQTYLDNSKSEVLPCPTENMKPDTANRLTSVINTNLMNATPLDQFGRSTNDLGGSSLPVQLDKYILAHSRACARPSVFNHDYSKIGADSSAGWFDGPMNNPKQEYFNLYRIDTGTPVHKHNLTQFSDTSARYLFLRKIQNLNDSFTLYHGARNNANADTTGCISGEVYGLGPKTVNKADTFLVRIDDHKECYSGGKHQFEISSSPSHNLASDSYLPVKYKLDPDNNRILMKYLAVESDRQTASDEATSETINLPVDCDRSSTNPDNFPIVYCYDHSENLNF